MVDNPFENVDGSSSDNTISFADATAKPYTHHDEQHVDPYSRERSRTYSDGSRDADDVNPKGLFRRTSVPELRYYYREGEFGKTLVNKPIDDAFKNGFDVDEASNGNDAFEFLMQYVPKLRLAEKKARRDGFAVMEFKTRERSGASISEPPSDVTDIEKFKVWTLDDLSPDVNELNVIKNVDVDVPRGEELQTEDIFVSENGLVILDNPKFPQHEELLGYGLFLKNGSTTFLHRDRCQHFAWNTEVDGHPSEKVFGKWEGDSILTPVVHVMRQIKKGNWGMGQALFRYSAPLHVVETPAEMSREQWEDLSDNVDNLNASSEFVSSPGTTVKSVDAASEFEPEGFYNVLIEQMCSGTEFTKPVLIGTQTGTVSGSETDIKSYFNQVQRYRQNRAEDKMREALRMASSMSPSIVPPFSVGNGLEIDWNPLFKVDQAERAEALRTTMNAATQAVQNYVMTPDEARSFVEEEYVSFDTNVTFDVLSEEDWDDLDRVNLRKTGQKSPSDEPDMGNPRVGQNGGGREGTGGGASNPTTDSAISNPFKTIPTTFEDEQRYHSGDKVTTPHGPGVVTDVYTEEITFSGETVLGSEENPTYVIAFGGKSRPYRHDVLELNNDLEDGETDGEALAPWMDEMSLDEFDMPPSWQNSDTATRDILLDFWSSVGGEQSQAANEMVSWNNVTEAEANAMAAMMKDAALGTQKWREAFGAASAS